MSKSSASAQNSNTGQRQPFQPSGFRSSVDIGYRESQLTIDDSVFKAYMPDILYKPPYGMPRKVNTPYLRNLCKNAYIYSVITTLANEVASVEWDIKVKDEFNDKASEYQTKVDEIKRFFRNPNGNDESFAFILKQLVTDILEVDAGVLVKVFGTDQKLRQIFARPGDTFLKNPNIYGYMGDRLQIVPPLPVTFLDVKIDFQGTTSSLQQSVVRQYDAVYKEHAAYFQYGWTAGSMPVPFGKREVVYISNNPRPDSIYGRSPIEVLEKAIQTLIYGGEYNLDFFTNSNMPDGMIALLGADEDQVTAFRERFENQFKYTDNLGVKRKKFFQYPISSAEPKFVPFQLSPADMEIVTQQQWFLKLMWMCFGVTPDEMGFTQDSNLNVSKEMIKANKRKAVKPLLDCLAYHLNTQIIPEFFLDGAEKDGQDQLIPPDYSDCPLEIVFDNYDPEDEKAKLDIFEQQLRMGVMTVDMVAKELGIDVNELKESRKNSEAEAMAFWGEHYPPQQAQGQSPLEGSPKKADDKPEPKPKDGLKSQGLDAESRELLNDIDSFIDDIGDALLKKVDQIPDDPSRGGGKPATSS